MHDAVAADSERAMFSNRHLRVLVGLERRTRQQCDAEADGDQVLHYDVVVTDMT